MKGNAGVMSCYVAGSIVEVTKGKLGQSSCCGILDDFSLRLSVRFGARKFLVVEQNLMPADNTFLSCANVIVTDRLRAADR